MGDAQVTELAVLVPVLNRPDNLAPLIASFLATTPGTLHVIGDGVADPAEYTAFTLHATERVIWEQTSLVTWPEKINEGVGRVEAEWYLFGADDVRFPPGWWDATKELRNDERIGVIGTNDSATGNGNPRVAAGEHTCHPLVRGEYVLHRGTIDVPGFAVHPAYSHWYVDDELIWTAKLRQAWAFCPGAVVEHLHPYWGLSEMDDTYHLGEVHAAEDMALWHDRAVRLLGLTVA